LQALPVPQSLALTEASRHDLSALQDGLEVTAAGNLFGDKAYKDAETAAKFFNKRSKTLHTGEKEIRSKTL
jgi:hypothetical protein